MKVSCEKIISENEKLKISDLEKSCVNTFEYLNLHHKVDFLKISIKTDEKILCIFDNLNSDSFLIDRLEFKQNCNTNVIFDFHSSNDSNTNEVREHLDSIKFSLQIFSQSIFNKFMERTIDEMSLVDHVTGSYNRCYLTNYANNIFSLTNREHKKVAFVKIAIDQFKAVIDEYDYSIGDKVLRSLSNSLKHSVRESDLVIKISNDEFLVVLMNVINEENARMISEKLINNFSMVETKVSKTSDQVLKKTICCGIALYPEDGNSLDEMLKKSDIALYEAQNRGRGQVFNFSNEDTHTIDFF